LQEFSSQIAMNNPKVPVPQLSLPMKSKKRILPEIRRDSAILVTKAALSEDEFVYLIVLTLLLTK